MKAAVITLWIVQATAGTAAQPVYKGGDPGVTPPAILREVKPSYPASARQQRIEGVVRMRAIVDAKGRARDIEVTRSLDPALDKSAAEALGKWRFKPASKDGKPVAYDVQVEMTFDLRGGRRDVVYDRTAAGVTPPVIAKDVKPSYTGRAMQDKARGTVEVEGIIEVDGFASDVRVIRGLHPELDVNAMNAFLQTRFKPATRNGVAVPFRVVMEYTFTLR